MPRFRRHLGQNGGPCVHDAVTQETAWRLFVTAVRRDTCVAQFGCGAELVVGWRTCGISPWACSSLSRRAHPTPTMPTGIPFPITAPLRPRPAGLRTAALQMSRKGAPPIDRVQPSKSRPLSRTTIEGLPFPLSLLVTLLAIAGCQPHRPDFMTRVRQDCAAGDRWACDLLDGLAHPKPDRASARGG